MTPLNDKKPFKLYHNKLIGRLIILKWINLFSAATFPCRSASISSLCLSSLNVKISVLYYEANSYHNPVITDANTMNVYYSIDYRRMAENGFAPPPLGNFADILSCRDLKAASFKRCLHSVLRGVSL